MRSRPASRRAASLAMGMPAMAKGSEPAKAKVDSGVVPVVDNGRVVGLVTDRDIVLRVVAEGRSFDAPVSEAMSDGEVLSVKEDDILADATAKMANHQVRRLVVLNDAGNLTGILSLGDVAKDYGAKQVGKTLEEISQEPGDAAH